MDSWDKFKETSLPSIEKFYSNLNMSGVNDEDYEHTYSIWQEFRIRNIGEYHDLYLRNIKLVSNEEEYLKNVMKPSFKSGTLLGPDLMGCEMGKVRVVMNKPVYLGQAILDSSKTIMYEFHCDYMKCKYDDDKLKLCYMDTDSLIYSIKTEDFYKDIADDVEARFNTSDYIPDRPLPVGKNKKVIGLMKDELGGKIMEEFISLRPKMYYYKVQNLRNARELRNVW